MVATATAVNDRRIGGESSQAPPARTDDSPPRVLPVWALKMRQDHIAETSALQRRISQLEDELMHTRTAARDLRELSLRNRAIVKRAERNQTARRAAPHLCRPV